MSGTESTFCLPNTLHTFNVRSVNEAPKYLRSKSIARSTFPGVILPSRYKVFRKLKEQWDPIKKEKTIKQRLHLATLSGVVNLRRMKLKRIPDNIFYLEMGDKKKTKVKEEEIMVLQHEKCKSQVEIGLESSSVTTLRLEKSTELIIEEDNISLSLENNQTKDNDDDDDKDFQLFLDNYSTEHGNVVSYGDVVKAYLKQRVSNFIQKILANRVPLIKHDKGKTSDTSLDRILLQNIPAELSVHTPQETTAPCKLICNRTMTTDFARIGTRTISKIPIKTSQKSAIWVPREKSTEFPISRFYTIPKDRFVSTGSEGELLDTEKKFMGIDSPTNLSLHGMEHCFFRRYSLFGVNPFMCKEFCVLKDIRDIEEIKNKVRLLLYYIHYKPQTDEEIQETHVRKMIKDVPQVVSRSSFGSTQVTQSEFIENYTSASIAKCLSNDTEMYDDFECTPEKYMFFQGDALMCLNPLTGDTFCIFQNLGDIQEIKNTIEQLLQSCLSESIKAVPSSYLAKEYSETNVPPYTRQSPTNVSEVPVSKLTECSQAMFIKLPIRTSKQLKITTKVANTDFWPTLTAPARKTTHVASKDVSHSITSKIPRPATSMSATRATVKKSSSIAPVKQTVSVAPKVILKSKIPRYVRDMSSAKARDDQSNIIRKRIPFIDTINMVVSEPALELTMDEVWRQKYAKEEDDTDMLCEEISKKLNFEISMKPHCSPIPKYEPFESNEGIPLQQGDSCMSLLGVIRKTTVTPLHNKGSEIPRSVVKLIKSPVTPEKKSKSFTDATKQFCRTPQQNISSDIWAASTTSRQQSKISTASICNVTKHPTNTKKKSQEKIRCSIVSCNSKTTYKQSGMSIKLVKGPPDFCKGKNVKEMSQKHGDEKQSHGQRIHSVGVVRENLQCTHHVELEKKRKNIYVLILEHNKITEISWKIGYLTNLTAIYLQNNMLQGIPNEIGKLQMLQKLQLDNNEITFLPVGFYNLKSLILLSLKGNKLIHVSSLIRDFKNLEYLNLSCNYLTKLPDGLDELYNLKQLRVSRNKIKIVPQSFPSNLQELYASDNVIESLPDLTNLRKLRILSVKANRLARLPYLSPFIQKIYASHNLIFYLDESLIKNWSKLETLNLTQNWLFNLPENINVLTSLKKLRLSHNEIRSLPRGLGKMYSLIELDISMNPIQGMPSRLMKGRDMYNLLKYIEEQRFHVDYSEDKCEADDVAKKEG